MEKCMKSRPVPRCVLKQSVLADMQAGIARRGDLVFQDDKDDHADWFSLFSRSLLFYGGPGPK